MGSRHRVLLLTLVLFAAVCVSRLVVFPASIWEQDEAYFAAAVVTIDLPRSAPHPPFFPLWIGLGKVTHGLGLEPAFGLRVASACLGSLMIFPLIALWSRFMPSNLAFSAAVLGLFAPGVWMLSGRAFSGTPATALTVAALACWVRPPPGRWWIAVGSSAAGLSVLIRPHVILVVAAAMIVLLAGPARRHALALTLPAALTTAVGSILFVFAAGGPGEVMAAVRRHASLHFGALPHASRSLLDSGLASALGGPGIAVGWCFFAVMGMWLAVRSKEHSLEASAVVAALVAAVLLVFGLSNPAHPRYAVPLIVLSSGFVVIGVRRLLTERWTVIGVTVAVAAAAVLVLPSAAVYRRQPSPPLRAFEEAQREAGRRGGVMVVDRTLHSFVVYLEATGRSSVPIVFDHVLEAGASPPPPASRAVALFDDAHDGLIERAEERRVFTCSDRLLKSLAQGRFLDLTVAGGATFVNRSPRKGPFVVLD